MSHNTPHLQAGRSTKSRNIHAAEFALPDENVRTVSQVPLVASIVALAAMVAGSVGLSWAYSANPRGTAFLLWIYIAVMVVLATIVVVGVAVFTRDWNWPGRWGLYIALLPGVLAGAALIAGFLVGMQGVRDAMHGGYVAPMMTELAIGMALMTIGVLGFWATFIVPPIRERYFPGR